MKIRFILRNVSFFIYIPSPRSSGNAGLEDSEIIQFNEMIEKLKIISLFILLMLVL